MIKLPLNYSPSCLAETKLKIMKKHRPPKEAVAWHCYEFGSKLFLIAFSVLKEFYLELSTNLQLFKKKQASDSALSLQSSLR
jgi:hypothetical protein